MTLSQTLSLISVVLAFLNFIEAVLKETAKKKIVRFVAQTVRVLEILKPRSFLSKINNKWLLMFLEVLAYFVFFYSIYIIFERYGLDINQLQGKDSDQLVKFFFRVINLFRNSLDSSLLSFVTLSIIVLIARRILSNSDDDFLNTQMDTIFGDGSFKHYFKELTKFLINLIGVVFIYWVIDIAVKHDIPYYLLSWLPDIISGIILFFLILSYLIMLPIFVVYMSSAFWLSFLIVCVLNFFEYTILLVEYILKWIYKDPKRSWAIVTALIALVVALGQFSEGNTSK